MHILNVDIESDGLPQWSSTLCINGAYLDSPENIISFNLKSLIDEIIDNNAVISMHNGYSFDIPFLIYHERSELNTDRLYTYLCSGRKVIDTLIISKLCYPFFMKHSLESWIERDRKSVV